MPDILGPEAQYRQKLASGTFELQQCASCQRHQYYPRVSCRYCGSGELQWVRASGKATVYSTTIIRRKAEEGGDYNVAIVELEEGPRMMSRIDGVSPEAVRIGQSVTSRIEQTDKNEAFLVFAPSEGDARNG